MNVWLVGWVNGWMDEWMDGQSTDCAQGLRAAYITVGISKKII